MCIQIYTQYHVVRFVVFFYIRFKSIIVFLITILSTVVVRVCVSRHSLHFLFGFSLFNNYKYLCYAVD